MKKIIHFLLSCIVSLGVFSLLTMIHIPWLLNIKGISLFYLSAPCAALSLPGFIGFLAILSKKALFNVCGMGFMPITCNIPTFFSMTYWKYNHWLIKVVVPSMCIALFMLHPVGYHAAAYSFYWIIPILLYFLPYQNIFFTALGATFIQHAIGSVIWLYMGSLCAEQWLALIPVVFIERMISVCAILTTVFVITFIESYIPFYVQKLYEHKKSLLRV